MNLFRLVLVTRRFWPLVGGAERVMANLAAELTRLNMQVTVLTAAWQPEWPSELRYRGVPVVRLPNPPRRRWGTFQYMRALAGWLKRNRDHYDLVYVSMLKHDAHAVIGAVQGRVPVVLRAEGAGHSGDCRWQLEAPFGRWIRRRARKAAALVAPSLAIREELIAAGYPQARVHFLPNGVAIPPPREAARRDAARAALATADPALALSATAPLAVYIGRLHEAKGLAHLVAAWTPVVTQWPSARLWLVGEGPYRAVLEEQIEARGLSGRVVLAGEFDNTDELLAAADLFVLPSLEEGMSLALLEAMAAGLPIVASDIPGNRDLVVDGEHGLLVPTQDANALATAVHQFLRHPRLAARLGAAARDRVIVDFPLSQTVAEHVSLFERLLVGQRHFRDGYYA